MALLEDYNAAYIDIDELGVRPQNWFDEQSALDFDGYLSCGKDGYPNAYTPDFLLTRQGASFKLEGENKSEDDDDNDDDADYAVDPETGKSSAFVRSAGAEMLAGCEAYRRRHFAVFFRPPCA